MSSKKRSCKGYDICKHCDEQVISIFEKVKYADADQLLIIARKFNKEVQYAKRCICPIKKKQKKQKKTVKEEGVSVFKEYSSILKPKKPNKIPYDMLELLKKRQERRLKEVKKVVVAERERVLLELIGFGYSRSEAQKVMKKIFGKGFSATTFKNMRDEYKRLALQVEEYYKREEIIRRAPQKVEYGAKDMLKLLQYAKYVRVKEGLSFKDAVCSAFRTFVKRECAIEKGEGRIPEWITGET